MALQRDLERMAATQGDLIRTCHRISCRLTELGVPHIEQPVEREAT